MAYIMMWIKEVGDGSFEIIHKELGILAHANNWNSAVSFFDRWSRIHTSIVEVSNERASRRPVRSTNL